MIRKMYNSDKTQFLGAMIDGKFISAAAILPEPTDGELAYAMRVISPMMSKGTQEDYLPTCLDVIRAAFREGAEIKKSVKDLIAIKHEKEEAVILGKGRHKDLVLDDLKKWYHQFVEDTPLHRAIWALRFESGLSRYLCPECGYSGHGFKMAYANSGWLTCPTCPVTDTVEVFTRLWTADEWNERKEEQRKQWVAAALIKGEKDKVARERQELIDSRAMEIRSRLPESTDSYMGAFDTASQIAADRLDFTVDDILKLWAPLDRLIQKMSEKGQISEEHDDLQELLIARTIKLESEGVLRGILETAEAEAWVTKWIAKNQSDLARNNREAV